MNKLELIQKPIIQHHVEKVGQSVSERINTLNIDNLVATTETIQTIKNLRAELRKESAEYEEQRKTIKNAILEPYSVFEFLYKDNILEKYKDAENTLKSKIYDFEMVIKTEKLESLKRYFEDLKTFERLEWLNFDSVGIGVPNLSTSETAYKKQIDAFISKAKEDIKLIETEEYKAEILVEYKECLDVIKSIRVVRERKDKEAIEEETFSETLKQCQAQREIKKEVLNSPIVEDNTKYSLKFEVEITKKQLDLLREFLISNNIEYKNL